MSKICKERVINVPHKVDFVVRGVGLAHFICFLKGSKHTQSFKEREQP
jgi:hypothetical protein